MKLSVKLAPTLLFPRHVAGTPQLDFLLVTGELLILDAERCWEAEPEIFATHAIPQRASADVSAGVAAPA